MTVKTCTIMGDHVITETPTVKRCKGSAYNFIFDKRSGMFARWGESKKDDPQFSPIGPEILDIEVTVNGCSAGCKFCYKENSSSKPTCMDFETYKNILDKMPQTLTQVAFGITDITSNPDFMKMVRYTKKKGIIPNFTMTGIDLTDEIADEVASVCGAVAISAYEGKKDLCFDTVKKMTDRGMDQVNIHLMVSKETIDFVYEVMNDTIKDPRLAKLNAVVFLGLKPKGRAKDNFSVLPYNEFKDLFEYCLKNDMKIGFDSCSAPKFERAVADSDFLNAKKKQAMIQFSESCESALFSSYINVYGDFFPCSFMEDEKDWENNGISVVNANSFIKDVWKNERVEEWRNDLIASSEGGCRKCIAFPEVNE
jgi:MoaA/NifB/PqqE/SkfB family radical SAM enzyme